MALKDEDYQEYLKNMQICIDVSQTSPTKWIEAHINADVILCSILEDIGLSEIVDLFDKVKRVYR